CQIALIGLPDDTGVKLNNGRPGAKEGPAAFRKALAKYGVAQPSGWDWPTVFDAGDVDVVPGDLHETHRRVTQAVKSLLDLGLLPIGIGGGHDLTFPFVRAVSDHFGPLEGMYFDAHLDVRETDGSGMPFRKLLETGAAQSLRVHGLDFNSNTREHVKWFTDQPNCHISEFDDPEDYYFSQIEVCAQPRSPSPIMSAPPNPLMDGYWPDSDAFVSLDLDVIDQAHAPGVSAHNACGWTPKQTEEWIRVAGRCPNTRCFDIMELSPPHDRDDRTARIAARMFLAFLQGYSQRDIPWDDENA
ncbi:MAG: arginase family protein, partial [Phycisphaerales bacterium]|nr:arginase family protein [Phycisphaerales bacterium]